MTAESSMETEIKQFKCGYNILDQFLNENTETEERFYNFERCVRLWNEFKPKMKKRMNNLESCAKSEDKM